MLNRIVHEGTIVGDDTPFPVTEGGQPKDGTIGLSVEMEGVDDEGIAAVEKLHRDWNEQEVVEPGTNDVRPFIPKSAPVVRDGSGQPPLPDTPDTTKPAPAKPEVKDKLNKDVFPVLEDETKKGSKK
jgi:hypothetical protein